VLNSTLTLQRMYRAHLRYMFGFAYNRKMQAKAKLIHRYSSPLSLLPFLLLPSHLALPPSPGQRVKSRPSAVFESLVASLPPRSASRSSRQPTLAS
jgi:hypothetical protein